MMSYKSMEGKQWLKERSVFDMIGDNIMNIELMLKNMKDLKKNYYSLLDIWKLMNYIMTYYLVCIVYIVRPYNATVNKDMIFGTHKWTVSEN